MTTAVTPFDFEGKQVRVQIDEDGMSWFNAGDVCEVLGFGNPRQAVDSHVDQEDVQKLDTLSAGGVQQANHINESGLYALIFGSTKPEAKQFKRWVTSEVLPSIRKTGAYMSKEVQQNLQEQLDQFEHRYHILERRLDRIMSEKEPASGIVCSSAVEIDPKAFLKFSRNVEEEWHVRLIDAWDEVFGDEPANVSQAFKHISDEDSNLGEILRWITQGYPPEWNRTRMRFHQWIKRNFYVKNSDGCWLYPCGNVNKMIGFQLMRKRNH